VGVAGAVVIPAALFAGWLPGLQNAEGVYDTSAAAPQIDAPEVTLDAETRAAIDDLPTNLVGIPVLSYHGISDGTSSLYTTSVTDFAEQMEALDAAGFETVTMDDVEAYVSGKGTDLPRRPIMLTFDDGVNSVWTTADPILESHRFNALAYLITSVVTDGAPGYYLSEPTLDAMVASRRWSFGAHTDDQHRRVETEDGEAPALINLEPDERYSEWIRRVDTDLAENVDAMTEMTGQRPRSFAFPFAANATPTNDPRIPGALADRVDDTFALSFLASRRELTTAVREGWAPYALPRLTVTNDMSAADLIELLGGMMQDGPAPDLSIERFADRDGGACLVRSSMVQVMPITTASDSLVACRSTGHGPFAAPAQVSTSVHLPSDRATAIVGLGSGSVEVDLEVGGVDVLLRIRQGNDDWRVVAEGTLDAFANDLWMKLAIRDGEVTATVGSLTLSAAAPSDDDARHLRLDSVVLGAVSSEDRVTFTAPRFEYGDGVGLPATSGDG
jgi:peptidoglycan/xylan/chitin deacetylase (PgdA/CDA1 family)